MADQEQDKVPANDPPRIRLTPKPKGDAPTAPTITGGPAKAVTPPKTVGRSKSETVRVDSVIAPSDSMDDTLEDSLKRTTMKIRTVVEDTSAFTSDETLEALKKTTVRVQVEDSKKGDTQRLAGDGMSEVKEQQDKRKTSRIDLSDVLEGEDSDIFKRRTALLDASKFPAQQAKSSGFASPTPGPKTIRIKQPETPPTAMLKKPATTRISETVVSPVQPADIQMSKKSETARIDLPVDVADSQQPPTRRKTIRIKRPEGTTTRTLVIARSGEGAEATEDSTVEREKAKVQAEEGPGTAFAVLSAVAAVITLILLYVLSAQTIAGNLPFPGKL
jgi:hypothetical protein